MANAELPQGFFRLSRKQSTYLQVLANTRYPELPNMMRTAILLPAPLHPSDPHIVLVYDAGDSSAVWASLQAQVGH
ncbi:hypothetical protein PABG_02686 [Paracoccidioides brasiliensis Pb03]|nr:hypothetical protein PABG_02686 [Paracoccidioides brasiliensis Pb03]